MKKITSHDLIELGFKRIDVDNEVAEMPFHYYVYNFGMYLPTLLSSKEKNYTTVFLHESGIWWDSLEEVKEVIKLIQKGVDNCGKGY